MTITADSRLCTEIVNIFRNTENLKGKCGAVVVMNYRTGEVLALVSLPVYDPQNITDQVRNSSQHPFWNRALQGTLPPGSTFKIITAAAAMENLPDAETHVFTCTGATQVMDHVVHDYNMDQHGEITLDKGLPCQLQQRLRPGGADDGRHRAAAHGGILRIQRQLPLPRPGGGEQRLSHREPQQL